MGIVASFQLRRADRRMARTLVFVKCAFAGDVTRLHEMITKDKISPNVQDRFGMTALHWAAYGGQLVCVQELIKAGASLTIVDANGRNVLHHACRKDHDEIVKYLLTEVHMHINALSESKDTPLHKAVIGKSIRCIEVLLQLGANPYLKNDQNRTPLEELDTDPSVVKDVLPEPIPTARMQEELENWRREFITEVESNPRRRSSLELLSKQTPSTTQGSAKKYTSTSTRSYREVENTLVTSFRARISEFSERSSSQGDASSSRTSSTGHFVTKGLWARATALHGSSSGSSASTTSIGRLDSISGKTMVHPLNLAGLEANAITPGRTQGAPHTDTSRSSTPHLETVPSTKNLRQRNLRYAGKRVIMAIRVKKCLTGNEKVEVIRLMLERHMKKLEMGPDTVHTIGEARSTTEEREPSSGSSMIRAMSGVKLSMPSTE